MKTQIKATWNPNGKEVTIRDIRTHSPHDGTPLSQPMVLTQLWSTDIEPVWYSAENFRINGNRISA
jgi:hypothetical protein